MVSQRTKLCGTLLSPAYSPPRRFESVGCCPSNRSVKASRRQLPNQSVPKKPMPTPALCTKVLQMRKMGSNYFRALVQRESSLLDRNNRGQYPPLSVSKKAIGGRHFLHQSYALTQFLAQRPILNLLIAYTRTRHNPILCS